MAVIFRPSGAGQLAEMLGTLGGAGIQKIMQERALGRREELFKSKNIDPRLARQPASVQSFVAASERAQAATAKEARKAGEKQRTTAEDKVHATEQLAAAQKTVDIMKERSGFSKAAHGVLGFAMKTFKQTPEEEALLTGILKGLYKNPELKAKGITQTTGSDPVGAIQKTLDEVGTALGITPEEAKAATEATPKEEAGVEDTEGLRAPTEAPPEEEIPQEEQQQQMAAQIPQEAQQQPPLPPDQPPIEPQQQVAQPRQDGGLLQQVGQIPGAAEVGAGIGGLPRVAASLANLVQRPGQYLAEKIAPEDLREALQKGREQMPLAQLERALPTRGEVFQKLGGKVAETELGRAGQELAADIGEEAAIQIPLALATGGTSMLIPVLKRIGIVKGVGNLAKWLTKEAGASEGVANAVKMGTSLMAAFKMTPSLKESAITNLRKAEESLPEGLIVKDQLRLTPVMRRVADIASKPESGYAGDLEVFAPAYTNRMSYRDAFKAIAEAETAGNPSPILDRAVETARNILKRDMKANPSVPASAARFMANGNEQWSQMKAGENVESILQGVPRLSSKLLKGGLGSIGLFSLVSAPKFVAAGIGMWGFSKGSDFLSALNLFATNPQMRDYYTNMIAAALSNNIPQTVRFAESLDKSIKSKIKKS